MKITYSLILILLLFACQKDDPQPTPLVNSSIIPEIELYVDRFVEEAKKHNIEVDVSNLKISTSVGLVEGEYCGLAYTNFNKTGNPKIIISQKCWKDRNDFYKEELIFHELGHAILNRSHDHSLLPDGSIKSLMYEGKTQYYPSVLNYRRDYYIAELFNSKEPVPEWARTFMVCDTTFLLIDPIKSLATTWIPNDTSYFKMYVDSMNYASPPFGLSIISNEKQEMKVPRFQRTLINSIQGDSIALQLNLRVLRENNRPEVIIRCFFQKGTKSWNIYKRLNLQSSIYVNGELVNDVDQYEVEIGKIENFDQIKISLEMNTNQTGKVTFDDIKLFTIEEKVAHYDE